MSYHAEDSLLMWPHPGLRPFIVCDYTRVNLDDLLSATPLRLVRVEGCDPPVQWIGGSPDTVKFYPIEDEL